MIAEAGVNHEGSMKNAELLIKNIAESGCNVVKFQTYKADKIVTRNAFSYWDTNSEKTKNQHELFSKYDSFEKKDFEKLKEIANQHGLEFMTTFFDVDSVHDMQHLVSRFKIASADLTNFHLLQTLASYAKPIILSTGASTIREVTKSVDYLAQLNVQDISVLHCVLRYPTEPEFSALNRIKQLKDTFPNLKIGISDHSKPDSSFNVLKTAYILGATIIEKHFTFDKNLNGNDHYHSFDKNDFIKLGIELKSIDKILEYNEEDYLQSQELAIKHARRGIYFKVGLKSGHVITEKDIIALRPSNNMKPEDFHKIIGSKLNTSVKEGEPVEFSKLIEEN
jgi:N-acetylneuraminate synthase